VSTQKIIVFWNRSATLLQQLRDLPCDEARPLVDHEAAVEVLLVVEAVLDLVAVAVELAHFRAVAPDVDVDVDLDDLVGGVAVPGPELGWRGEGLAVNRVLPVARAHLKRLWAAFGEA
jgi:hypothetical protein